MPTQAIHVKRSALATDDLSSLSILTRLEAAKVARVSVDAIDSQLSAPRDHLPHLRMGRRILIERSALLTWMRRQAEKRRPRVQVTKRATASK